MSTTSAGAARARATRPVPPRAPALQVVPRNAGVRRGSGFVVLVAALLVSGLIGLLLLNLSMQKGAFELAGLQASTTELQVQEQALDQELEGIQSTQSLARQATGQGMVPSSNPMFLDLSDGSIVGQPVPAAPGQTLPGLTRPEPPERTVRPGRGTDTPSETTDPPGPAGQTDPSARRTGN